MKKLFSALIAFFCLTTAAQAATQWTYQYAGLTHWGGNTVNALATVTFNDSSGVILSQTGVPQVGMMSWWPESVTRFDITFADPNEGHKGGLTSITGEVQAYSVTSAGAGAGFGVGYSAIIYGAVHTAVDQHGHDTIVDPVLGRLNSVYLSFLPRNLQNPDLNAMPDFASWNQVVLGYNWDGGGQADFVGRVGAPTVVDLSSPVDEPHPGVLLAGGIAMLGFMGRRRRLT